MPFKGNDFQHTRDEAYVADSYDKYGQEHDEFLQRLVDVENGARQYWAKQLRAEHERQGIPCAGDGCESLRLIRLLDPYSGQDGANGKFARTTLDDADEGAKYVTPNEKIK
jgi:hypothetical protein